MRPFAYDQPTSLAEALAALSDGSDTVVIAGGTALVLLMKQGLVRPERVLALRRIDGLRGIARGADGGLELRALTTLRDAERSEAVRGYSPALAHAFGSVATVRIRNQATVGGNLVHADPAQDPPPMLMALGAAAVVVGSSGERTVPLDRFFVDVFETALAPDEILTSIRLPPLPARSRSTYVKFVPNTKDDYPTVSVGAWLDLGPDGRCRDVRIGLAGVGSTPIRAAAVEDAVRSRPLDEATIAAAAELVGGDIDPIDDARGSSAYKRRMAVVWVRRALSDLAHGGGLAQ